MNEITEVIAAGSSMVSPAEPQPGTLWIDMLSPAFDRPMAAREVEQIMRRAGVVEYRFLNRVPVEVTGSVPVP